MNCATRRPSNLATVEARCAQLNLWDMSPRPGWSSWRPVVGISGLWQAESIYLQAPAYRVLACSTFPIADYPGHVSRAVKSVKGEDAWRLAIDAERGAAERAAATVRHEGERAWRKGQV